MSKLTTVSAETQGSSCGGVQFGFRECVLICGDGFYSGRYAKHFIGTVNKYIHDSERAETRLRGIDLQFNN